MTEFLSYEELMQALGEEAERTPEPVFVAPKPTDKGYHARRKALMDFKMRAADLQKEATKFQTKIERLSAEVTRLMEQLAATPDDGLRATLQTRIDEETRRIEAAFAETKALLDLTEALAAEQVEFLLPYFKAIKYPTGADGWTYKPRPKDGPELDAFLAELRPLVMDVSQADLQAMMQALDPQTPAVPPKSSGK